MKLEGLHHVTAICADAPGNVDFYARVLGLRLVKKTVNFDAPTVYHLYYGDEAGAPGSIMTFFEFPGARRGRAGAGMVHTVCWRVGSVDALDFWERRLGAEGVSPLDRSGRALRFADPEGLGLALMVNEDVVDAPLAAAAPDIPAEHAIQGFHGVRAYAHDASGSDEVLRALGMEEDASAPGRWLARGDERQGQLKWDPPPPDAGGIEGAGTVHHIAWSAADDSVLEELRTRVRDAGAHPTPVIDRQYFHSIYFRVPAGVLFELATRDIGFAVDEPAETLGQALKLPAQHEDRRAELERTLTPISPPR